MMLNLTSQLCNNGFTCAQLQMGLADWVFLHVGPYGFTAIMVFIIVLPYATSELIRKKTGVDLIQSFIDEFRKGNDEN